ncbi:ABC transporter ATP-binding protein [Thermodesulfobacteriota bacterium]
MHECLLDVRDLKVHFPLRGGIFWRRIGTVFAVDGVSLAISPGRTLGLVGESGCGKTTVARAIVRLYRPTSGEVWFEGRNLARMRQKDLRGIRRDIQMIFQDPFESLNPRHTVGQIMEEPFVIHGIGTRKERESEITRQLERVGMGSHSINKFPHEFSGGQRQRIGIARAIALQPRLVVCDEPVSALDVSIQSQILNLLLELQQEMGLTYLFIAHDLAVVKHISDSIAVMYLGKIVEYTDSESLYERPLHPYTQALISAIPVPDPTVTSTKEILHGDVPSPVTPPPGCRFHTRCPHTAERCTVEEPFLRTLPSLTPTAHMVACHRVEEINRFVHKT